MKNKYLTLSGGLISVIIIFLLYDYKFILEESFLNFNENETNNETIPTFRIIIVITAMLLGILLGALFNQVKDKSSISSYKTEISETLKSVHLFKVLLVAPLLFAGIYLSTKTNPDKIIAVILAFQNGFFCESILRENEKKDS